MTLAQSYSLQGVLKSLFSITW